jgi:hypothetical protein
MLPLVCRSCGAVDAPVLTLCLERRACVARCQHETQFVLEEQPYDLDTGGGFTPPVQCGIVARVDPRGRFFCFVHMQSRWSCFSCHAPLPDGEGGFCSPACQADYDRAVAEYGEA